MEQEISCGGKRMKLSNKWLAWSAILIILFIIVSGFFLLRSGLVDFGTGEANEDVIYELELFSAQMNNFLGLPPDYEDEALSKLEIEVGK